jgi:hypothetical protein
MKRRTFLVGGLAGPTLLQRAAAAAALRPFRPSLRETFVEAFAEARRAGKARFAAITTHGLPNHIGALVVPGSRSRP